MYLPPPHKYLNDSNLMRDASKDGTENNEQESTNREQSEESKKEATERSKPVLSASKAIEKLLTDFYDSKNKWIDILVLSTLNFGARISDTASLKFGTEFSLPQAKDIVDRHRTSNRFQYIFPITQWKKRENELQSSVSGTLNSILGEIGFKGTANQAPMEAWIEAAMACGANDSEIKVLVSLIPQKYAYLKYAKDIEVSEGRAKELQKKVADYFIDYGEHWYTIKVNGIRAIYKKVDKKNPEKSGEEKAENIISALKDTGLVSETAYPYETTVKRILKTFHVFKRPYLAQYLFAKFPANKAHEIELAIKPFGGRLVTARGKAPKKPAIVNPKEMNRFLLAVGALAKGLERKNIEVSELTPGKTVLINIKGFERAFEIITTPDKSGNGGFVELTVFFLEEKNGQIMRYAQRLKTRVEDISVFE